MEIYMGPHTKGEPGLLCMPLVKHFPKNYGERRPSWRTVNCPSCGAECYETDQLRTVLEDEPKLKAVCTLCALKLGGRA